jgi:pimeloyl-ACP methyl ester carboxylesterase
MYEKEVRWISAAHPPLAYTAMKNAHPISHHIQLNGTRLHYLEWGEAANPPLVLLHGGAAHAHWWDHIAPILAHNYRVIALDLRGHGDSAWTIPAAYEIDDYVADVAALVDTLELAPMTLLGHSLGGLITLAYAIAQPQLLRGLIVVDMRARLRTSRYMRLLQAMPAPVYQDEQDLLRRFRLLPADTQASPQLLHAIAQHSVRPMMDKKLQLKSDRAALTRAPRDLEGQLSRLTCPTLFIRGQDSRYLSARALAELIQTCPDARGTEIPHAGHHVFLDNPTAFLQAVKIFLDERGTNDIVEGKLQ